MKFSFIQIYSVNDRANHVQPFMNTFRTKILFLTGIVKNERKVIIRQKRQQPAANGIDGLITFISGNLHLLHRLSRHSRARIFIARVYQQVIAGRLAFVTSGKLVIVLANVFHSCRPAFRGESRLKKKRTRALSNAFVDTTSRHRHRYCNRCNCAKKNIPAV